MDILLVHTEAGRDDLAQRAFEAAGHVVHRCHEHEPHEVPCRGLEAQCPLTEGIDVVVDVRSVRSHGLEGPEDGALCALQSRVPVVVADPWGDHPLAGLHDVVRTVAGSSMSGLVRAAEETAADASPAHGRAASRAVQRPGMDERIAVNVFRRRGILDAVVVVPPATSPVERHDLADRVRSGLRSYDRTAVTIEVTFAER